MCDSNVAFRTQFPLEKGLVRPCLEHVSVWPPDPLSSIASGTCSCSIRCGQGRGSGRHRGHRDIAWCLLERDGLRRQRGMVRKPQNSRGDGRAVVHRRRAFVWQCGGAQCGFPWGAEPPLQFSSLGCSFLGWRGVRANTLIRAHAHPCKHADPRVRSLSVQACMLVVFLFNPVS